MRQIRIGLFCLGVALTLYNYFSSNESVYPANELRVTAEAGKDGQSTDVVLYSTKTNEEIARENYGRGTFVNHGDLKVLADTKVAFVQTVLGAAQQKQLELTVIRVQDGRFFVLDTNPRGRLPKLVESQTRFIASIIALSK